MKELDFSEQIRAKLYPIEKEDDSILAAERFGGKKRGELKDSDFLDSKRRSFPVVSCADVKDAVSTWGMYKGPMSFDSFKSKLKSRAKNLGCATALPESWDKESKSGAKTKEQWEKIDKKELDRDTKKEKKEHEKDAVKDDESKINKLKKGKPSEKKSVEEHDLKKDEKFDKEKGKGGLPPWLKDKKELKKDTKKEKEEHEKDAVKDDKKQIKDLKKDEKEDKKAEKKDKK